MRSQYIWVSIAALIVLAIGVLYLSFGLRSDAPRMPTVHIDGKEISVYVADTEEERKKGLSGFPGLEDDRGMLFIFPSDSPYGFWMKDMLFSIDIIWLAADGTVVDMVENVSPDTYPEVFVPEKPARFVLELSAGGAKRYDLSLGDRVDL